MVVEFLEIVFVYLVNFVYVFFVDVVVEIDNKGFNNVGDVVGGIKIGFRWL